MTLIIPYCQNCGRPSHCGVPLHEDFRREPYNHDVEDMVEVCKYCRCLHCSKIDRVDGKPD